MIKVWYDKKSDMTKSLIWQKVGYDKNYYGILLFAMTRMPMFFLSDLMHGVAIIHDSHDLISPHPPHPTTTF